MQVRDDAGCNFRAAYSIDRSAEAGPKGDELTKKIPESCQGEPNTLGKETSTPIIVSSKSLNQHFGET